MSAGLPEYVSPCGPGRWRVQIRVVPGARKDAVDGMHDGRLKVRLTAPAVDNKANKALVAFAATLFHVKKSGVSIASGEKSREKTLLIAAETSPSWPA
jgi:hypothetical protein